MPSGDGWDWPWLYYTGTVILRMTEQEFWKCFPRKLSELTRVHIELNSKKDGSEGESQQGFIDQVF